MPPPQTLAAAAVLTVLALVAILSSHTDAPVYDSYSSTDYSAGGYRAWATLLAREGITTERFILRPIELDARIDTLVSAQPVASAVDPATRSAADVGALAAWVRRGGRLVYLGRNAAVREAETHLVDLPFLLPDVGSRGRLTGELAALVASLHELGTDRMLLVEHAGRAVLSDGNGDVVVRYPLGRGEIVAAVDPAPFTNENIARDQNARLAYLLGMPRRAGGVVAFDDGIHGALIDRLWYRALPLPLRVALGLSAIALVLGLIGSALRGSPPMALAATREPTSQEFIAALAALHERLTARAAARDVLLEAALATAARKAGLQAGAPSEEITQRMDDRAGADDIRRAAAMLGASALSDRDLVASAKLAHAIRKENSYDGNDDRTRAAFAGGSRTRRRR